YDWWRKQVVDIKGGHRYFYMMCLCIYASKCDVPYSKLKEDMIEDFGYMAKNIDHLNPLTDEDMKSALETYSKAYYNYNISDIEKLTDIRIERNKRNGRKQEQHINVMNAIREVIYPNGEWRNKNGQPTKEDIVSKWRLDNPKGKKVACHKDTGLDPKTIRKWWNG
ncbi:MAG: hypothetical protein ACRC42_02095, partial [Mycoplasma sp.]